MPRREGTWTITIHGDEGLHGAICSDLEWGAFERRAGQAFARAALMRHATVEFVPDDAEPAVADACPQPPAPVGSRR